MIGYSCAVDTFPVLWCFLWCYVLTKYVVVASVSCVTEPLQLNGNSTLKNISPKINIYDKWIYVSVIKLMMQIRYRTILTIKLLFSRNVFLHEGGSTKLSSLFLYLCLFVDVGMVTRNGCSYVLSCGKRALFPLSGRKFRNHSIHISSPFRYVMLLLTVDLQQSMAQLKSLVQ